MDEIETRSLLGGKLTRFRSSPWFKAVVSCAAVCAVGVLAVVFLVVNPSDGGRARTHSALVFEDPYCQASMPISSSYSPPATAARLRNVQVIVRHGDRAPCNVLPVENTSWYCNPVESTVVGGVPTTRLFVNDFPIPMNLWEGSCTECQLTERGFQQHQLLGRRLFDIYAPQLSISGPQTYVRSTNADRARQSAESMVSGVFNNQPVRGPITIYSAIDDSVDIVGAAPSQCPALVQLYNELSSSGPWLEHLSNNADLKADLDAICHTASLDDWGTSYDHFFDNFHCRTCHEKPLPCSNGNCVTPSMASRVFEIANWEWKYRYWGYRRFDKVAMEISPLLETLWEHITSPDSFRHPITNDVYTLYLYGAHDGTVGPLLSALNISGYDWPAYAANLILEFWEPLDSETPPFVRALYNGQPMTVGNCASVECPISELNSYLTQYILRDYYAMCHPQ